MITFITGNKHKVKEAEEIFQKFNIELEHMDLGYIEPQGTLEDVAKAGAKYAAEKLNKPVIVEDAGLFIKALNWFPGTYSSFVQDTIGNKGILNLMNDIDDASNCDTSNNSIDIDNSTDNLTDDSIDDSIDNPKDRYAEFRSVIGYCAPNIEPKIFLGKVQGQIAFEEKGNKGFAFDPIFYVPEKNKTFGELSTSEKNQFSHRKNSLDLFINWYISNNNENNNES
ncbi:MAG: non-canonical purine NTP pyrophosphatase [Methanobrevibacter sp.]|jgi:XTP/dITP diphosphohydrolase|nr:non-canonical purine NTP pyrophosphatase [Methanobrevibacter sp.]